LLRNLLLIFLSLFFVFSAYGQITPIHSIGDPVFVLQETKEVVTCPQCKQTHEMASAWVCSSTPLGVIEIQVCISASGTVTTYMTKEGPFLEGDLVTTAVLGQIECDRRNGVVHFEPPVPLPKGFVPWVECNDMNSTRIKGIIAGLETWSELTDTVIVSTAPGASGLYALLQAFGPDIRVIPGMKTYKRLKATPDSLEGWALVAKDVSEILETSGERTVVLENESALKAYWDGEVEIDIDKFRAGLQLLPKSVRYIWYPVVSPGKERGSRIIEAVEEVLDVRFVDFDISCEAATRSWYAPQRKTNAEGIAKVAEKPTLPIVYFYTQYWRPDQIEEILRHTSAQTIIPYPGSTLWAESALAIAKAIATEPEDPEKPPLPPVDPPPVDPPVIDPITTNPPLIPWLEVNQGSSREEDRKVERDTCVAGAKIWAGVTDTIIVSTNTGHADLYMELRERLPNMTIIPGLKTNDMLKGKFDSPDAWKAFAVEVNAVLKTSGQRTLVFEHESCLGDLWRGGDPLDLEQVKKGLEYLPQGVKYIWYPVLLANNDQRSVYVPLMKMVQDTIDCQLADITICEPPNRRDNKTAQAALVDLSNDYVAAPMIYLEYFGSTLYWRNTQIREILERGKDRPYLIMYPGSSDWVSSATEVIAILREKK